jgi:hypothetical protein
MVDIQLAQDEHFEEIWSIIHAILEKGDTYPFAPDTSRAEAFEIWMKYPKATYVAYHDGEMVRRIYGGFEGQGQRYWQGHV